MGTLKEGANSAWDPDSGISELAYQRIQARIKANRDAKFRARDVAYRLALGLPPLGGELPKALGVVNGAASAKSLHLRGTKRIA